MLRSKQTFLQLSPWQCFTITCKEMFEIVSISWGSLFHAYMLPSLLPLFKLTVFAPVGKARTDMPTSSKHECASLYWDLRQHFDAFFQQMCEKNRHTLSSQQYLSILVSQQFVDQICDLQYIDMENIPFLIGSENSLLGDSSSGTAFTSFYWCLGSWTAN